MPQPPERVLVVDDYQPMRSLLITMLRQLQLTEVDQAHNGTKALERYRNHRHALVFLDIDLPDLSGLQVLEALREYSPPPFVVMQTGDAKRDTVMRAQELGVSGFIAKPYNMEKVSQVVRAYRQHPKT